MSLKLEGLKGYGGGTGWGASLSIAKTTYLQATPHRSQDPEAAPISQNALL